MKTAALLLLAVLSCWLASSEAGLLLDKAGQVAKDVHETVHEGAKKVGDGFRGIFHRGESTTVPPGKVHCNTSPSTLDAGKSVDVTTQDPRNIIGTIKRCAPGEVLAVGECRPAD